MTTRNKIFWPGRDSTRACWPSTHSARRKRPAGCWSSILACRWPNSAAGRGEELYAASAYLSREPILVGPLRGQDIGKAFLLLSMVIGTILATIGALVGTQAFVPLLQLFQIGRAHV